MKTTYTNEQLQEAMDVAFHESSGDDGFWVGIARAFLDNLPEPQPPVVDGNHSRPLSRLRPLSEARPVPEGCQRIYLWEEEKGFWVPWWEFEEETSTHFADIRLPVPAEKADPLVTKSDSSPEWTPQVGDVVRLKSGGPLMTVARLAEDDPSAVLCEWFDKSNRYDAGHITIACLKPSTKEDAR